MNEIIVTFLFLIHTNAVSFWIEAVERVCACCLYDFNRLERKLTLNTSHSEVARGCNICSADNSKCATKTSCVERNFQFCSQSAGNKRYNLQFYAVGNYVVMQLLSSGML